MTSKPQACAICVLQDTFGRILLLQRATDALLGPGCWAFPGGRLEPNESIEQCAWRELCEEIGPQELLLISRCGPCEDIWYGGRYAAYLLHYRWLRGRIQLNSEHTAFAWVGSTEFKQYAVLNGVQDDLQILGIWPQFVPGRQWTSVTES